MARVRNQVATEIRPIYRSEAVAYLKVLPFANGLPSWEPAPAAWHGGPGAWPPPSPPASEQDLARFVEEVTAEGYHAQAAFVDGQLVGATAMLSLGLTVPGLRTVPMGGVTSTGVIATHRRRGLLRQMMQAMFDQALERGEVVAGLSASEGSIYGRFGFSPATTRTRWEIERTDAALIESYASAGTLELTDAATARRLWPVLHDVVRRQRVGEVSTLAERWDSLSDASSGTDGALHYLTHTGPDGELDGIAHYRLPWSPVLEETGTLVVERLDATTDEAYRALWRLLLDVDLTRRIVAASRPADEPLRWMLRNPRALRVTRQSDNLWVRLLDVPTALAARSYETSGTLVFAIDADPMCPHNAGTWRLQTDRNGATCSRVDAPPEVSMDIQCLGSLYLGGVSPFLLASAGRLRQHRAGATATASRLFRTDPAPFNAMGF